MVSLDVESLFTNNPLNETIIASVICAIKIFIMGNSEKETFSNFWKQQLTNHLLFLITCFINKLTEWQWVLLWVPPLQMQFYAILKNGWIIVQSTWNLWYTKGMLMILLFFFHLKNTSNFLQIIWAKSINVLNLHLKQKMITLSRF